MEGARHGIRIFGSRFIEYFEMAEKYSKKRTDCSHRSTTTAIIKGLLQIHRRYKYIPRATPGTHIIMAWRNDL